MLQSKYKYSGKDVRNNETQREKFPKKDVELCLEVEMDDEVREIITSPEKCVSALLDVTVIKPKDLDQLYYSQKATLSGEEVRKLIASMELEKQDKQKLIDKILSAEDPKSSGDYVKKKYVKKVTGPPKVDRQRISTTDDTNSDPVYAYKHKPGKKGDERVQHIYTTPKTYSDIRSIFTCKNRNKFDQNEKPDKPCLCKNCAIIGVLTDSQKKPFITENLHDPRELLSNNKKDNKRKKFVNFKNYPDDHTDCEYYFKQLSTKIRQLEERLSIQEEKSVPRDYFKRIITKLVNHLSKITNYASYDSPSTRPKSKETKEYKAREKYCIHPVLLGQKPSKVDIDEFLPTTTTFDCTDKYQQTTDNFWRWGEEILKPGIDLKNKIVMLLEETLHNLKKPRSVPSKLKVTERAIAGSVEAPQKLQVEEPVRDLPTNVCKNCPLVNNNVSGSIMFKPKKCRSCEKVRRYLQSKQDCGYEESLNVSYLNPRMRKWQEESQVSFKLDSSLDSFRCPEDRKLNDVYKTEFRETLSNTKESDKLKLWHSVWIQAKMNGQNRDDKVTIQMPDRKNLRNNKTVEIEYTIAELEELLVGFGSYRHNSKKRNDTK
ncbi:uncharacterized protein LOC111691805 [Anoplophora glabripennis]|uniref:uncharacterized protein LOC111691805 n=1 Tax=Anoplophora glabripennis TaxID=217634 RepID=UPI000C77BCEE|nr:uncharacterized protein LOC111691805 [Anoplophora glabripennis]